VSSSPDRTFYNEVCKKLAGFVKNATSLQEIRDFCGVTTTDFNQTEITKNITVLQKYIYIPVLFVFLPMSYGAVMCVSNNAVKLGWMFSFLVCSVIRFIVTAHSSRDYSLFWDVAGSMKRWSLQ